MFCYAIYHKNQKCSVEGALFDIGPWIFLECLIDVQIIENIFRCNKKNPAQSSIDVNKFITHLSLIVFKYEKTHIYVFSSSSKKHKLFALCTPSHAYVVSYDYLTC